MFRGEVVSAFSMKNFFHAIASFSFVIWTIGFYAYEVNSSFHYWLLVAIVAAAIRIWAFKKTAAA